MAEEKRGKFIVLEGIDGSGKSSQIKNIVEFILKDKYNHVLVTREPYKNREIRKLLREEQNPYTKARKLAELFVQDREEHVSDLILPALKKGMHVVSDRYKLATISYQAAQGLLMQELIDMHENLPVPDVTFVIDVPVEYASA